MQALVWKGPRRMALETHDEPQPAADEALLRVRAAGVCGSELEGYLGLSSLRVPPLVMGHEFSGEIVTLNGDASGLRLGQLVTANPLVSCGHCPVCHTGRRYLCPHRALLGAHRPGGFAAYVAVPIAQLIPLPEHLTPTLGALAEPFAVALHAVGLARLSPGEAAVVWGAGSIGLLTVCAARLARAEPIIAVDTNPARLVAATALGAHPTPGAIHLTLCQPHTRLVGADEWRGQGAGVVCATSSARRSMSCAPAMSPCACLTRARVA